MMEEIWKDIEGFEGLYQASTFGRIKSIERKVTIPNGSRIVKEKILKLTPHHRAYCVNLCKENNHNILVVHKIIAKTFIPNPKNKPLVRHLNGDMTDNRIANLEWFQNADASEIIGEMWRDIDDKYQISNFGRVKNSKDVILKSRLSKWGYPVITLSSRKPTHIHRLVAKAFIENPTELPVINHINGIKTDNRVENLEWCTQSHNMREAFRIGLKQGVKGEKNRFSKLKQFQVDIIRRQIENGLPMKVIAKQFDVSRGTIGMIKSNKRWAI